MLPDSLCPKVDRMLMAFGLEGRVPFLDHRIVEFGLTLPDELKIAPHQGKLFLKRWGQQFFPSDHLDRRKRGFSVPVKRLLNGRLLDALSERLPRSPAIQRLFRPAGVHSLINHHRQTGKMADHIWSLVQIALWHRIFIEGKGTAPSVESELLDWL